MVHLAQPCEEEQLLCNEPSQRFSCEQSGYLPGFFPRCFILRVTTSQLSPENTATQSFWDRAHSCNARWLLQTALPASVT